MKVKSFTLMEILIVLIIIAILASVSVAVYDRTIASANEKLCEQNQLMINTLIKMYIDEYNDVPASLGQIPDRYFKKAFAKILQKDWLFMSKRKLYSALINFGKPKQAIAQPGFAQFAGARQYLVCPNDKNGFDPSNNNYSYAINDILVSWKTPPNKYNSAIEAYNDFLAHNWPLICDSDEAQFGMFYQGEGIHKNQLKIRHGKIFGSKYAVSITASGHKLKYDKNGWLLKNSPHNADR